MLTGVYTYMCAGTWMKVCVCVHVLQRNNDLCEGNCKQRGAVRGQIANN